jgi:hypothetical protein
MANFSRLPDNTPTPHQATARRVFGRDLESWKGFTQRSFFCRPEFYSHLIGKKKKVRALYYRLLSFLKSGSLVCEHGLNTPRRFVIGAFFRCI